MISKTEAEWLLADEENEPTIETALAALASLIEAHEEIERLRAGLLHVRVMVFNFATTPDIVARINDALNAASSSESGREG